MIRQRAPRNLALHALIRPLVAALLFLFAVDASAQTPSVGDGFNVFRGLRTRFIFDPERRAMVGEASAPRSQTAPAPRAKFIALTGTMVTATRTLAFFNGSQSDYSKVIPVGESIADFKVADITPTQVTLDRAGQQVTVPVGKQLPLGEGFTGRVENITPGAAAAPPAESSSAPASTAQTPSAPGSSSDKNEVHRRMMERRQKEESR